MRAARGTSWRLWILGFVGCMALILAAGSTASAQTPVKLSSFGPDGTEASDFEGINGVARDQNTGAVYVLDNTADALYKFDSKGQPVNYTGTAPYISGNRISGISSNATGLLGLAQVAVDPTSHVIYVTERETLKAFTEDGEPAEFTAGPGAGTNEINGFGLLAGIAVDANGSIYASDWTAGISIFSSSGAPLTSFAASRSENLSVGTDGTVYLIEDAQRVRRALPSEFPVTAGTTYSASTLFGRQSASNFIVGIGLELSLSSVYAIETNFGKAWIRKYDSSGGFEESIGEPGTPGEDEALGGRAQGIATVGVNEEFYVGNTKAGEGAFSKVARFGLAIPEGPPTVPSVSVSEVTANSATLRASINPNTFATTYRFEYGLESCASSACTSVPIGEAAIGDGHEPVAVSQALTGLSPETTYHYRVIAQNEEGVVIEPEGSDLTFTTQSASLAFELSDSRVWEMVSPGNKRGGVLVGAAEGPIQAAVDGESVIYGSRGSIDLDPEGNRTVEQSAVLAQRGAGGWGSEDITPPNGRVIPLAGGFQGEYNLFSPDLSMAILEPRDGASLSPQASERTPYLRHNTEPPLYTPLVTGKEGFANVPSGTEFGGSPTKPIGSVRLKGANASLSHVALYSEVPLAAGAPKSALYLWTAGQLLPLSVLPASEGGGIAAAEWIGSGAGTVENAVSEDGRSVFWSTGNYGRGGNGLTALYLRDTEAEETARLDIVQPGASGAGLNRPAFQGASTDGSVVFFSDSHQLTEGASTKGRDLYRCEISDESPALGCASLTNISAPTLGTLGESAEVLGLTAGLSEDGERVYFVAKGILDAAPNGSGESAKSGEPNLYVWQQGAGVRFIAGLSEDDDANWGGSFGETSRLGASASPSGRYFAFMSEGGPTGFNNSDVASGEPLQEVFLYDAVNDRLRCVSCNPSGALPKGEAVEPERWLVDPRRQWEGRDVAAILPGPTIVEVAGISMYRPRVVLDSGRVFFNAIDSLVSADSNGEWDVYQYEPLGAGSCTAASSGGAVSRSGDGCVGLLSSGTGSEETGFLDASLSGDDVFFLTSAQLSVLDKDSEPDVYDARVGGSSATLPPISECIGESCRSSAAPPTVPRPASGTFDGPGDIKGRTCPKGKKKVKRGGKVRCVPKKQKNRKKQQKKKQAGKSGRASR